VEKNGDLVLEEHPEMTAELSPVIEEPAAGSRILLVDDNTDNLRVLRESLQGLGCSILVAKSGISALTIVKRAHPDLILLDITMPGMDGYEVCRRLKEDEATRHIPVLLLTGLADAEDEARGLDLGAMDYITKPIRPGLVRARVCNHLELKRYQNHLGEMVKTRTQELPLTQTFVTNWMMPPLSCSTFQRHCTTSARWR